MASSKNRKTKRTRLRLFLGPAILGVVLLIAAAWCWIYGIEFLPLRKSYETEALRFALEEPLPVKVTEAGGTAMGHHFYLVGGIGPLANTYSSVFCFDVQTSRWAQLENFPEPISHPGVVAGNGKVYVMGGFNPLGIRIRGFMFADWRPRKALYVYDVAQKTWTKGPDMPEARGAGGVCLHDSAIYYAGGINMEKGLSASLFKFSITDSRWDVLPPMPTARDHLRMEAVNGKLYAISGRKDDLRFNLTTVESYDIESMTWSSKADIPIGRGGFGSAVLDGKIYTFGGENVWKCFDTIERYDPVADTWTNVGLLPEPRHGICAGTIDGKMHLVSGGMRPRISVSGIHRTMMVKHGVDNRP